MSGGASWKLVEPGYCRVFTGVLLFRKQESATYLPGRCEQRTLVSCASYSPILMLTLTISETILMLAAERGREKTICPSEVARQLSAADWRKYMEEVRKAAFELRDKGKVRILQKGSEVTGREVVGPIRIQIR